MEVLFITKTNELFTAGVVAIVTGYAAIPFAGMPALGMGLMVAGWTACVYGYSLNSNKYRTLFKNCNLHKEEMYPTLREERKTDYGYVLRFSLPLGLSSADFESKQKAIKEHLGHRVRISYTNKNIIIQVYEHELEEDYPFELMKTKNPMDIVIGYTYGKRLITTNLASGADRPHMLIAGETGCGKSTIIRGIVAHKILSPHNVRLHLIDMKRGAELGMFKKCNRVDSFSKTVEEAEATLIKIQAEVDRRYELFEEVDCVDIKEYNKKHSSLQYWLVVIDEFSLLREEKSAIATMETLTATARACGIHLILSTQRPDKEVVNGRIKANVTNVVGLRVKDQVNSRIIIDEAGLEKLRGKGHGLYDGQEIQSLNLIPELCRELIKPTYIEKQKERRDTGEVNDFNFLQ